jgi:penicillin amidase
MQVPGMKPLRFRHARRSFQAARDEYGIPHVRAESWHDALYALGFLHAVDRPTQLLFSRAVASGRSAELIADRPELLETDRFFRRVGLHVGLEAEIAALDDDSLSALHAYCEGVNHGLKQAGRSLPMWATGFRPEPWEPTAVLLLANLLNFGGLVVSQQQNERLIVELIQAGVDRDKLRELFSPLLDDADFDLLTRVRIANRLSDQALELITDLPRLAGSNAWAVSPIRSASGSALLASDPHLEVNRLPGVWYEAMLSWSGEYVLGATLPGCPIFAVARNRQLAWGVTYMKADTFDSFIEDTRRHRGVWQYRRGDEWREFDVRHEVIRRKNGPAETLLVYSNPQGTLEGDPEVYGPGLVLSLAWSGTHTGSGRSLSTWLNLVFCSATRQAMDLVRDCPQPTLIWVFADRGGHIGRQANGWIPVRGGGYSGLLPIPAWDEANHWQGWHPSSVLPSDYDPPRGYVSAANEDVNPPGGPRLITQPLADYRKRRIDERLAALPQATLADMQALQYDVVSVQARDLLAVFLPHLPPGEIRDRLAAWDGSFSPQSYEATLFTRLYRNVLLEVFGQDPRRQGGLGWRRLLYLCTRAGFSMMVVTCLDRTLKQERSLWWEGRDKGELIRRAAARLEEAEEQPWEVTNAFQFTNRFFEARFVGRALGFHTSELGMPGCHATPFQGHLLRVAKRETTFAPSYHFVTDLATDEAWTNLPGGASESRFSRWYKNLIPLWLEGRYKRLGPLPEEPPATPSSSAV